SGFARRWSASPNTYWSYAMSKPLFEEYLRDAIDERGPEIRDRLSSPSIQSEFVTRLLLGFIAAHASKSSVANRKRVNGAMAALFGSVPSHLLRAKDDDDLLA